MADAKDYGLAGLAFARSLAAAFITDLLEEGASDERIERFIQRLDQANCKIVDERVQTIATEQTAGLLAALRGMQRQKPPLADDEPPAPPG